jgi:arabinose-5-phosphate isomerase
MHDLNDDGILAHGRDILRAEGEAVLRAADALDASFCRGVKTILGCSGSVVVTGIGKAGLVARKISATLASTSTETVEA